MITNSFIDVKSISLLSELKQAHLLNHLTIVKKEEIAGDLYPYWLFRNIPEVKSIYDNFIEKHGGDSRDVDKSMWDKYDPELFKQGKNGKFIKTHGYSVINRLIDEGDLIYYLLFADEENGRRRFKFACCDRIEEIKREETIKSDLLYKKRMRENK